VRQTTWNTGDVFVAVGNGSYNVYDNAGIFKQTITSPPGRYHDRLLVQPRGRQALHDQREQQQSGGVRQRRPPSDPPDHLDELREERIDRLCCGWDLLRLAHIAGCSIDHYDAAGSHHLEYGSGRPHRLMDLAKDQKTMFYYSDEVSHAVHRYDVSARSAIPDFATGLPGPQYVRTASSPARRWDGAASWWPTSNAGIQRLDGSGHIVQTYNAPGETKWFAVNLDPNGTSFWSGSATTDNFYRFNIATGAKELGPINIGSMRPGPAYGNLRQG